MRGKVGGDFVGRLRVQCAAAAAAAETAARRGGAAVAGNVRMRKALRGRRRTRRDAETEGINRPDWMQIPQFGAFLFLL